MPPKEPLEQANNFGLSLARGEPNRKQISLTIFAGKVHELIKQVAGKPGFCAIRCCYIAQGNSV